jgi:hypothetical protein
MKFLPVNNSILLIDQLSTILNDPVEICLELIWIV